MIQKNFFSKTFLSHLRTMDGPLKNFINQNIQIKQIYQHMEY
jgi:hypothetical protein